MYDEAGAMFAVSPIGEPTNAAQIATAILSNSSYVSGQAIRCIVCYGANGPAQQLSGYLNAPWKAATDVVQVMPNGNINILNNGTWLTGGN